MKRLVDLLISKGLTIASCESLTGGLFCQKMTEIPGVSACLKGGIVTYWNEIKVNVAKVSQKTVDDYGVVSWQTAREMARNVSEIFKCDIGVSFTGNAGPDTLEGKPKGLVYSCIWYRDSYYEFEDLINLERNELRADIVKMTAERLYSILEAEKPVGGN